MKKEVINQELESSLRVQSPSLRAIAKQSKKGQWIASPSGFAMTNPHTNKHGLTRIITNLFLWIASGFALAMTVATEAHGQVSPEKTPANFRENVPDYTQWKEWVIFDYELPDGCQQPDPVGVTYTIQGDTIIDGVQRGVLYFSLWTEQTPELTGFIHQTENRMYFRAAEGVNLRDKYILLRPEQTPEQEDILLYDFSLEINAPWRDCWGDYILSDIQPVSIGNSQRKKYSFSSTMYPSLKIYWIEGMGSTINLFEPVTAAPADMYYKRLVCFSENDEVLWINPDYTDCNGLTSNNPVIGFSSLIRINPVNEHSYRISSPSPMQEIDVYDARGMLVFKQDMQASFHYTLNGQSWKPGVYVANILLQNKVSGQKKLIVK